MNTMLLAETGSDKLVATVKLLGIIALIVLACFAVVSIFAGIWKWILIAKYRKLNRQKVSNGLTGEQTAKELLKALDMENVEVVKCNFFSSIFLGNSYSPFKKRIRLRKNIFNSSSLTAVALATQKVALAKRDKDGDKKLKVRSVFTTLGYFSPFAVLPLILIGVVIDLISKQGIGIFTIIFSAIALIWYFSSFIVLLLNIPIEKKGCKMAVEFFEKTNMLTETEIEDAKSLYKTYITSYVLDFIQQILYIVWRMFKLIARIFKIVKK